MNAKPQYYIQAEFALSGWITLLHVDDAKVETTWYQDIIDTALATPWIASMARGESEYGDMLRVRLVQESMDICYTKTVNNETPANQQ